MNIQWAARGSPVLAIEGGDNVEHCGSRTVFIYGPI
jgi:hypothetical protein